MHLTNQFHQLHNTPTQMRSESVIEDMWIFDNMKEKRHRFMFEDAEQNQLFDDSKFESYRHAGELAFPQEMFDSAALSNILHDLENIECGGAISSWEIPQTPCNSPQFACSFDYARPQLASPFFYPWPPTWTSPSCPSTQPSPSSPPTTTFECMKSCQYQSPREPQTCSQIQKKITSWTILE